MDSLLAPFRKIMRELCPSKDLRLPSVTPWTMLSFTIVLPVLSAIPRQRPHSKSHNFLLIPPIEVFLSILEFGRHEPSNALGLILVTPNLLRWEVFPTPRGPHPYLDHLSPLTNGTTSLERHFGVPLVPMVLWALLKERCATIWKQYITT